MRTSFATLLALGLAIALSQPGFGQFDEAANEQANEDQNKPVYYIPATGTSGTTTTLKPILPTGPSATFSDKSSGITYEPIGTGTVGLRISKVDKFGLGNFNGFEVGDVLKKFTNRSISSQTDLDNAMKAIPSGAKSVPIEIMDVNFRSMQSGPYFLLSNAGTYQTNFGELKLSERRTTVAGQTLWEGTLFFKDKSLGESTIKGTFSGGTFQGTSTHPKFGTKKVVLKKSIGDMYMGNVIDGPKRTTFVIMKKE